MEARNKAHQALDVMIEEVDALLILLSTSPDSTSQLCSNPPIQLHDNSSPQIDENSSLHSAPLLVYNPPKDDTLASISSLTDAFGGYLYKISYSPIFNKKSLKKIYAVVANQTLYTFSSLDFKLKCESMFPITKKTRAKKKKIKKKEKENFFETRLEELKEKKIKLSNKPDDLLLMLTFETDIKLNDDGLGINIIEKVKKNVELVFKDEFEFETWYEIFQDAINDANNGKIPISTKLEDKSTNKLKSDPKFDDDDDALSFNSSRDSGINFYKPLQSQHFILRDSIIDTSSFEASLEDF
ncbi:hypothetical protein HDU92_008094 [Lobulomyces angularis]|nr:hypothetical protein HDU92_008094 [Lobulomyces angularis]